MEAAVNYTLNEEFFRTLVNVISFTADEDHVKIKVLSVEANGQEEYYYLITLSDIVHIEFSRAYLDMEFSIIEASVWHYNETERGLIYHIPYQGEEMKDARILLFELGTHLLLVGFHQAVITRCK